MSEPRALGRYFYGDRLPGQARRFYDVLDSRLAGGDYRAEVPLTLEERDRPEYFFLGRKMTFFSSGGREGRLRMQILYTPAEIETLKTTFRQKMLPLMAGTADKSLVQREELIYSRLARQLRYQNTRSEQEHNLVGPMLASRGVRGAERPAVVLPAPGRSDLCAGSRKRAHGEPLLGDGLAERRTGALRCDLGEAGKGRDALSVLQPDGRADRTGSQRVCRAEPARLLHRDVQLLPAARAQRLFAGRTGRPSAQRCPAGRHGLWAAAAVVYRCADEPGGQRGPARPAGMLEHLPCGFAGGRCPYETGGPLNQQEVYPCCSG